MGAQAKAKFQRRSDRKVKRELENSGAAERARNAYLGLRREDVQAEIRNRYDEKVPWGERLSLLECARASLTHFGYDLDGLVIKAKTYPGRYVVVDGHIEQEPHRVEFVADISAESLAEAERAAGAKLSGRPGATLTN